MTASGKMNADAVLVRSRQELEDLAEELGVTVDDLRARDPEAVDRVLAGGRDFVAVVGEIPAIPAGMPAPVVVDVVKPGTPVHKPAARSKLPSARTLFLSNSRNRVW